MLLNSLRLQPLPRCPVKPAQRCANCRTAFYCRKGVFRLRSVLRAHCLFFACLNSHSVDGLIGRLTRRSAKRLSLRQKWRQQHWRRPELVVPRLQSRKRSIKMCSVGALVDSETSHSKFRGSGFPAFQQHTTSCLLRLCLWPRLRISLDPACSTVSRSTARRAWRLAEGWMTPVTTASALIDGPSEVSSLGNHQGAAPEDVSRLAGTTGSPLRSAAPCCISTRLHGGQVC